MRQSIIWTSRLRALPIRYALSTKSATGEGRPGEIPAAQSGHMHGQRGCDFIKKSGRGVPDGSIGQRCACELKRIGVADLKD
eukprot:2933501-Pleurochrysis_carterae.AAC.3